MAKRDLKAEFGKAFLEVTRDEGEAATVPVRVLIVGRSTTLRLTLSATLAKQLGDELYGVTWPGHAAEFDADTVTPDPDAVRRAIARENPAADEAEAATRIPDDHPLVQEFRSEMGREPGDDPETLRIWST